MKKTDNTTNIFGYKIYSNDATRLLKELSVLLKENSRLTSIFTPNPEQIVLSSRSKSFAKALGFADILIPDGSGLVFSSKILAFLGKKEGSIKERITGIDLSKSLLKIAKNNNYKVLVIGGRDYEGREYNGFKVNSDLGKFKPFNKNKVSKKQLIWWSEGYNKVSNQTDGENRAIVSAIKTIKPDIVFVALGAPFQEKWIVENSDFLKEVGVSIVMVVGGTFDVLLGKINRAPEWMQNMGLEWFYRLVKEPWRWRRQLGLLEFVKLVFWKVLE